MVVLDLRLPKLEEMEKEITNRVEPRAFRRTVKGVATEGSKKVRRELKARAKDIKKAIRARVALSRGDVIFERFFLPLDAFNPRQTRKGASVLIKRGRKVVRGFFMISAKSGKCLVVRRKTKKRHPVARGFTTGVSALATNVGFFSDLSESAQDRFTREVESGIRHETRKGAGLR